MFIVMRCTQCNEHWAVPVEGTNQVGGTAEKKAFTEMMKSGMLKCQKCGSTQITMVSF